METPDDQRKALANLLDLVVVVNKIDLDSSLEQLFDAAEKLDALPFDSNGLIRSGVLSVLEAVDIASYRCPEVKDDLKLGVLSILLALVELGLQKHRDEVPQEELAKHNQRLAESLAKRMRSLDASKAANARHKDNRAYKAAALADWNEGTHTFSSMRAFARNSYKKYGVTDYQTVYGWLRSSNKAKH